LPSLAGSLLLGSAEVGLFCAQEATMMAANKQSEIFFNMLLINLQIIENQNVVNIN
jgi:hypothetical protein